MSLALSDALQNEGMHEGSSRPCLRNLWDSSDTIYSVRRLHQPQHFAVKFMLRESCGNARLLTGMLTSPPVSCRVRQLSIALNLSNSVQELNKYNRDTTDLSTMPPKEDFPPLLPGGLYARTLADIQEQCVDAFVESRSRPQLFAGLRNLIQELSDADGLQGDLWIDGSFVTQKLNPGDVDVVLYAADLTTDAQAHLVELLGRIGKRDYGCDFYFAQELDVLESYWRGQYGTDRSGNSKGIMVVSINGGVA